MILLNLIIAIVSRTFLEFFLDKVGIDREIKLKMIIEIDEFLRGEKQESNLEEWKKKAIGFQAIEKIQEIPNLEKLKNEIIASEERIMEIIDQKQKETNDQIKEQRKVFEEKMIKSFKLLEEKLRG